MTDWASSRKRPIQHVAFHSISDKVDWNRKSLYEFEFAPFVSGWHSFRRDNLIHSCSHASLSICICPMLLCINSSLTHASKTQTNSFYINTELLDWNKSWSHCKSPNPRTSRKRLRSVLQNGRRKLRDGMNRFLQSAQHHQCSNNRRVVQASPLPPPHPQHSRNERIIQTTATQILFSHKRF